MACRRKSAPPLDLIGHRSGRLCSTGRHRLIYRGGWHGRLSRSCSNDSRSHSGWRTDCGNGGGRPGRRIYRYDSCSWPAKSRNGGGWLNGRKDWRRSRRPQAGGLRLILILFFRRREATCPARQRICDLVMNSLKKVLDWRSYAFVYRTEGTEHLIFRHFQSVADSLGKSVLKGQVISACLLLRTRGCRGRCLYCICCAGGWISRAGIG
jgi:hypothetical protein